MAGNTASIAPLTRKTGIKILGGLPWGTHFCQFYKTKQDLLEILVPYFKAGLESNELCVLVTSEFLDENDAREALEKAVPDFAKRFKNGQIEIFPYTEWYLKEGKFEMKRVLDQWIKKYDQGIKAGYDGCRVSGNPFWIGNKKDWNDFSEYEAEINNVIGPYKLLVLCTYSLDKCGAGEILDVVTNHEFAVIKRNGRWAKIEGSSNERVRKDLRERESQYRSLFGSMTESFALCEIILDSKGKPVDYRMIDVNPAYEKFVGLGRSEIVGKLRSRIPIPMSPKSFRNYARVALTGKPAEFENYNQVLDKQYKVRVYCPAPRHFATIFTDITEQKKAEKKLAQSERTYRGLFENIGEMLAIYRIRRDKSGRISERILVDGNRAMFEAAGAASIEDIRGKTMGEILGEHYSAATLGEVRKIIASGKTGHFQSHDSKSGKSYINTITPLDENFYAAATKDITEIKKFEEELKISEEKSRTIVQYAPAMIYEMDFAGLKFISVNDVMCSMLGYSRRQLMKMKPADLIDEESRQMFAQRIKRKLAGEDIPESAEYRGLTKDGREMWVSVKTTFTYRDGKPATAVVVAHDITERKKTADQLRMTLESIGDGFFACDGDWRFVYVNGQAERILDIRRDEVIGKSHWEVFPLTVGTDLEREYRRAAAGEMRDFENFYEPWGRWFHNTCYPREGGGMSVYFRDITEQKKAETKLFESEERFRMALRNAPVSVAEQDQDLRFVWAYNQRTIDPAQVIGKTDADIFDADSAARLVGLKRKAMETGEIVREKLWVVSNGHKRFIDVYIEPARDKDGRISGLRLASVDLTQVKLAEEAIKVREEQFSKVFYSAPVGTCLFEIDKKETEGRLFDANETFLKLSGYKREEIVGRDNNELKLIDKSDAKNILFGELAKTGSFTNREMRLHCKDGSCKDVLASGQVLEIGGKRLALGMMSDITDRKKMEARIEKLASFPKMNPNPVIEMNLSGEITYCNDAAARVVREESKKGIQVFLPEKFSKIIVASKKNAAPEVFWREVNVGSRVFRESIHVLNDLGVIRLYAFDITDRKRMEAQLNKLNRTLWALSSSNQALLHIDDETELLQKICKIIVEDCGHAMVWIGYARNDEAKSVTPEAYAGFEKGYLEKLNVTWADTERGRGPTGTAIRSGTPQQCKNMLTDPRFKPWRGESQKRGYASSLALPLQIGGKVLGAMTIYSKKPDGFPNEEEILLLSELADNLAYGIASLRTRHENQQAQETLRETKEYLDNLLDYANAPIVVWDPEFRVTRFNRAAEVLSGMKSKNILGKNLDMLFPKDGRERILKYLQETLEGRRWETVEIPIRRKDGSIRNVVWNSAAIFDDQGSRIVATIAQGQDITEAKMAQAALTARTKQLARMVGDLKKLKLAVENASDIIFITDAQGKIISINKAVEPLMGYKPGDMIGKTLAVFDRNADEEFYRQLWDDVKKQKKPSVREIVNVRKNGQAAVFELHVSPVMDSRGEIFSFIGIERDRTEAKAIDRAKTEFISMASHQLRTPLSTLSLTAQMLLNGAIGAIDGDARKQIKEILNITDQMAALVDLLLNISRVEMGKLVIDPQPMEIPAFVKEEIDKVKPQALKKKIDLRSRVAAKLPLINADRKILDMALDNLLCNALKYTPDGGRVTLSVEKIGDEVVFSVSDTGIGVPKNQQSMMLFTKMFRGSNVGSVKGMGLGLNMAKNIIEQSGGRTWFKPLPGKGSQFSITVPLSGMKKREIRLES